MPLTWLGEAFDYPADPESGATRVRLTTSLKHHINVYCEHSFSSPDGKRIAILRSFHADPRIPPYDLLVGDLEKLRIAVVESDVAGYVVATASWSGWIYYLNDRRELMRVNLNTLDKEVVWTRWPFDPDFILHTVSPDLRYLLGQLCQASYNTALVRIDLLEKTWKIIFEHPEISNAHPLFNPIHGRDISVMMARGYKVNNWAEYLPVEGSTPGTTHFIIDCDGGNLRTLPLGPPHTPSCSGHSQWMGDTGRYACTVGWDIKTWQLNPQWPQGNVFTAAPGEKEARMFAMPDQRCNHIATSKCGRYFVCDSYPDNIPGRVPLVVGNFQTGKYRELLTNCQASCGASACSHAHPYFTADNQHVIYNADPYMVGHVYAARVPPAFLESLD
ncbi:hypothetical protein HQ590_11225 [bacterium]|nr:hypothetical protein [bacterium]